MELNGFVAAAKARVEGITRQQTRLFTDVPQLGASSYCRKPFSTHLSRVMVPSIVYLFFLFCLSPFPLPDRFQLVNLKTGECPHRPTRPRSVPFIHWYLSIICLRVGFARSFVKNAGGMVEESKVEISCEILICEEFIHEPIRIEAHMISTQLPNCGSYWSYFKNQLNVCILEHWSFIIFKCW